MTTQDSDSNLHLNQRTSMTNVIDADRDRGGIQRPRAVILMDPEQFASVWPSEELAALDQLVEVVETPTQGSLSLPTYSGVDVLITGWGAPPLTAELLSRLPDLRVVLHAAGSVRGLGTPEFWSRDIPVASALDTNTRPTAEFAAAEIVYALKKGWQSTRALHKSRDWYEGALEIPGLYNSVVGLVSLGRVGRYVAERLVLIGGIRVLAFDPFTTARDAAALGIELVGLPELFAVSDVVSLHSPALPSTKGLVTESLLKSLKFGATFINTSRGSIVDEPALIRVLTERHDLFAALDVTDPEPPAADSPLWDLSNVVLTPHIAGSSGDERRTLALFVLRQLELYIAGDPLDAVDAHDRPAHVASRSLQS
jgi:phosphoglycerate dehydrogenase-like enzyme